MQQSCAQQLSHQKAHAASRVEVIHIGAAVRVDACEQRNHIRQLAEVVPRNDGAARACHRNQMQGVIRRAACGEQSDDRIHDGALIDRACKRQIFRAQCGDPGGTFRGRARQGIAQRRIRRNESGTRQMQSHHFHQHLIAVGRAIERAGACGVIALGFGFEQRVATDLAFGEQLTDACLFLVGDARWHRPCGDEDRGQMTEGQGAHQQSRHDLVADTQAQRRIEHVVRQGDGSGHRNHVAAEERQLHACLALCDTVAHCRHAACELCDRTGFAGSEFEQCRIALERLMGREHVVIGGDDRQVRPAQLFQCLLVGRIRGRKTMRKVRTGEAGTSGLAPGCLLHACQIVLPRVAATFANTFRHRADTVVQRRCQGRISTLFSPDCRESTRLPHRRNTDGAPQSANAAPLR